MVAGSVNVRTTHHGTSTAATVAAAAIGSRERTRFDDAGGCRRFTRVVIGTQTTLGVVADSVDRASPPARPPIPSAYREGLPPMGRSGSVGDQTEPSSPTATPESGTLTVLESAVVHPDQ